MNILVTGSNGQLGRELQAIAVKYNHRWIFADRSSLDITNSIAVREFLDLHQPDAIINAAAYTAVDRAEQEYFLADEINCHAVRSIAKEAADRKIKFIHISTDYVFDGQGVQPYQVDDSCNPKSIYGLSKRNGEVAMINAAPDNSVIIRTSWLYSVYGHNFVKTMLRLGYEGKSIKVVSDQKGSPTNAADLAKGILDLLPKLDHSGVKVLHYANKGETSWYDFAKAIFQKAGLTVVLKSVTSSGYPTPAPRPKYSVLDTAIFEDTCGVKIPNWEESLGSVVSSLNVPVE